MPYIKLVADDPYYDMTINLGLLGKGWVRLGRYNLAKYLGRILYSNEQVRHKDKDKTNNDPSNLHILTTKILMSKDNWEDS